VNSPTLRWVSINVRGPAHRIRKRQFSFRLGRQRRTWSLKQLWGRALA
jgi:hypothetical protein